MTKYTVSEIQTFRECPRKHHYAYVELRIPKRDDEKLFVGQLFHKGADIFWAGGTHADAIAMLNDSDADKHVKAKVGVMLAGYWARWEKPSGKVQNAVRIQHDVIDGESDGIIDDVSNGRRLLRETKTTSMDIAPGGAYFNRLLLDTQVHLYADHFKCDLIMYDVVRKPANKVRENVGEYVEAMAQSVMKDLDKYYQRYYFAPEESIDRMLDFYETVNLIKSGYKVKHDGSCMKWGSLCGYWGVCSGTQSINELDLKDQKHMELK